MRQGPMGRKPSPSMAVSLVALFIALGGVAWAASAVPRDSVTSKSIRDGRIKSVDIRDGQIGSADIADGSLAGRDLDPSALERLEGPPGPQGDVGPRGDVGPPGPPGPSTGSAGGDLAGAYPDPSLATDAVQTAEIQNGQVTSAKLDFDPATQAELDGYVADDVGCAGCVGAADLADDAVGTGALANSIPAAAVQAESLVVPAGTTSATISMGGELWDSASMFDASTSATRVFAPVRGIYSVTVGLSMAGDGSPGVTRVQVARGPVAPGPPAIVGYSEVRDSGTGVHSFSTTVLMDAGEHLTLRAVNATTGDVTVSEIADVPSLAMTWIAPGP